MKWCLQCGKPNDILNETCEECDNPNFYDPNAKAGDAEIKSLRAERDNLAAANAELTRALHLGVYLLTIPAIQDVMRSQLENDELSPIADFENSAHAVLAKGAKPDDNKNAGLRVCSFCGKKNSLVVDYCDECGINLNLRNKDE